MICDPVRRGPFHIHAIQLGTVVADISMRGRTDTGAHPIMPPTYEHGAVAADLYFCMDPISGLDTPSSLAGAVPPKKHDRISSRKYGSMTC